ncbi:MAG: peptide chain release factor aRF-1 [Candidatus Diapherotrites archaeon]|nr:peptide chain release factor aRF-1 [Candidatus Diapherotrites archaeon]
MVKNELAEDFEAEMSVFKKKLKFFKEFKGKGTELISLYVPATADRGSVMGQITEETSQSSNIKSQLTRKNVQGALRKIGNFLKQINFRIPENGIVVFCGNVSEREGVSDIKLFTVKPIQKLKTKLYWCDSRFHLDPLEEMVKPNEYYAILVVDKREATIALLIGKKYEIQGHFTSNVAGKIKAGGQSAGRFEQLRVEAEKEFFGRISERMNSILLQHGDKVKGLIIAGPGITKNEFLEREMLDYRLKQKIMGSIDTSYTDESGIREVMQQSDSLLKDAEVTKERQIMNKFMEEIAKDGLVTYGEKEVMQAIESRKAKTVMVSEGLGWDAVKIECEACGNVEDFVIKDPATFKSKELKCSKCDSSKVEELEEIDYIDLIIEKAHAVGADVKVLSTDTPEGEQFLKSFGGLGAFLRYK